MMSHLGNFPKLLNEKPVLFAEQKVGRFNIGVAQLNRPKALNSLNTDCYKLLEPRLLAWATDPEIAAVIIESSSEKAFCAGGDVKALTLDTLAEGLDIAKDFFTREYFVDYLIHIFPKPVVVFADGITMGGGIGLMNGGSHRLVTEKTVMAMPELAIGLFPDVGATRFLSELPWQFGYFMGLTGARISGADAVHVGLADFYITSQLKRKVFVDLLQLPWVGEGARDRDLLTQYFSEALEVPPEAQNLKAYKDEVEEIFMRSFPPPASGGAGGFSEKGVEYPGKNRECSKKGDVCLETVGTYHSLYDEFTKHVPRSDFIADAQKRFLTGSPTSKQVFHAAIHRHRNFDFKNVFIAEWEMAIRFCKEKEFFEGVRAVLIDKDNSPKWDPQDERQVSDLDRFFTSGEENLLAAKLRDFRL